MGFGSQETVGSIINFEREANSAGIKIQQYVSDGGKAYTGKAFQDHLFDNKHTIKHSGVGGHHHNAAEVAIKVITHRTRTSQFLQALCWPEKSDVALWWFAMQHSVHMYNVSPKQGHHIAPVELWTGTKSSNTELKNSHVWGCHVYVLLTRLQDGHKIPRWE